MHLVKQDTLHKVPVLQSHTEHQCWSIFVGLTLSPVLLADCEHKKETLKEMSSTAGMFDQLVVTTECLAGCICKRSAMLPEWADPKWLEVLLPLFLVMDSFVCCRSADKRQGTICASRMKPLCASSGIWTLRQGRKEDMKAIKELAQREK